MKKLAVLGVALCVSTAAFAQKTGKNLAKALDVALSRQVAKQTVRIPCVPNAAYKCPALSLGRVVDEAMHPEMDISKLVPIPTSEQTFPSTVRFDMRYIQERIQSHGNFATSVFYDKEATLGLYRLIATDIEGKLTAPEQIQLQYLFWHGHNPISEVERELQSWKAKWSLPPLLPTYERVDNWIMQLYRTPRLDIQEEWALAAQIYMLQKLYGDDLPEIIKNTNVIPAEERQIVAFERKFKKAQETVEHLRATGKLDSLWMKEIVIDIMYDNANQLARNVGGFYQLFIDKHLEIFPRAKYLATSQEGRLYEIPLQKGLVLEGPSGKKEITPQEYVVFKADGENPILLKRADVELLTDPSAYGEK